VHVLGIDTSTAIISAAILRDGVLLGERTDTVEHNRTGLLTMIDALVADVGLRPLDIDAVAVGAGPGSFTGLRIGMATAKGIAFALSRPLWAVSSLAAVAHATLAPDDIATVMIAVLDARRGEVYGGAYRRTTAAASVMLIGDERVLAPADVTSLAPPDSVTRYAGDAAVSYPELAPLAARWTMATPSGRAVAELALAGSRADILVGGAPTYIRPSEAEVKYPDGVPGALRKRD
jgi:tRNA threonylcarbamoyladenosine biosynthesis protein TsaB